jgi:hypothetical protein
VHGRLSPLWHLARRDRREQDVSRRRSVPQVERRGGRGDGECGDEGVDGEVYFREAGGLVGRDFVMILERVALDMVDDS